MKTKKLLALLLTLSLLTMSSVFAVTPVAAVTETVHAWDGTSTTVFDGGDGSAAYPYLISTAEQLAGMVISQNNTSDNHYKLTKDIYINDTTDPDWKTKNPKNWFFEKYFYGELDGDGHTVRGLYYNNSDSPQEGIWVGLIPWVKGKNVSLKNITISESAIINMGSKNCGTAALIGYITDGTYASIINCYIDDTVSLTAGGAGCAGFIGSGGFDTVLFYRCASFAEISDTAASTKRHGSFFGNMNAGNRYAGFNNCIGNEVYTNYGVRATITASYCAVEGTDNYNNSWQQTTDVLPEVVGLNDMKGAAASENMPLLDWNTWNTTDGYPVIGNVSPENRSYSFENWTGSSNGKSQSGISFTSPARTGEKSLCYNLPAGTSNYKTPRLALLEESRIVRTVEPGKTYELSFWYKVDGTPANSGKFLLYTSYEYNVTSNETRKEQVLNKTIIFDHDTSGLGTGGWVNAKVKFTAELLNNNYNCLALGFVGTGNAPVDVNIYIDDVTVKAASTEETAPGEIWNGAVSESFSSGDGSHANPYIIETATQFAKAVTNTAEPGKYYKLTRDIYLNDVSADNWAENAENEWFDRLYGMNKKSFSGTFDGAGHTVYGLYYNGYDNTGLFPIAENAEIKNLRISKAYLKAAAADTSIGAMVGMGRGTLFFSCCAVDESVTVTATDGASGFVGNGEPSVTAERCYSLGVLSGAMQGAFFGKVWQGEGGNTRELINCFVTGAPLIWDGSGEDPVSALNCYGTVAETEVITGDGFITVIAEQDMKGAEALTAMNKLEGFYAAEGYPAIRSIGELLGDVNGDWNGNSEDIAALRKHFLGISNVGLFDINSDACEDIRDFIFLKKLLSAGTVNTNSYQLVWSDDFQGAVLNSNKWSESPMVSYADGIFYTYDEANLKQGNGNLALKSFENPYYDPNGDTVYKKSRYLVSGSVHTSRASKEEADKMSYKYGYLEARIRAPYKKGCAPGFWLRSAGATGSNQNAKYDIEVDVMEVFSSENSFHSNLHQHMRGDGQNIQTTSPEIQGQEEFVFDNYQNLSDEYHIYGFEWTKDSMAVYVDGKLNCKWLLTPENLASYGLDPDATGFDTTMNIILGNNLYNRNSILKLDDVIEDNPDSLPSEFDIDYIRLYQKNDGLSELYLNG